MFESTFRHRPPPRHIQYAMGVMMYGLLRPVIWGLEKSGRAVTALRKISAARGKHERRKNPFSKYPLGPQDVVVMTYAKSGTNWTMQIAHQLIYHGKGEFGHIHDVVPWPDTEIMGGFMKNYAIPFEQAQHWKTSPEKQRVIKTHFNWDLLPYSPEARYIGVIRDPKDVFVSNYFFVRNSLGPSMPKVETWYQAFLAGGGLPGGSWAVNAAGYWAERHRPNVLLLSFREMKRDLRAAVVEIAGFLKIDATPALIDEVTRLSSFEYMKKIDEKFAVGKVIPWAQAFHSPTLRVYGSSDVAGVEVGGAVKNVLAIATGLCDGLQLGLNARAALITRGLAEMTRLGVALGADIETFMGLSGLGDLVLTATGDLSRNRKVGLLLAQGKTLSEAVTSLGHVAEGVYCARTVSQRALSLGVDMPITQCVVKVLDGTLSAKQAVGVLMGRDATEEL